MTVTGINATIARQRKEKWSKAVKPYFQACLTCQRSCAVLGNRTETASTIETCSKPHGEAVQYPYLIGKSEKEIEEIKKEIKKNAKRK
jgi:hypothetical protein